MWTRDTNIRKPKITSNISNSNNFNCGLNILYLLNSYTTAEANNSLYLSKGSYNTEHTKYKNQQTKRGKKTGVLHLEVTEKTDLEGKRA